MSRPGKKKKNRSPGASGRKAWIAFLRGEGGAPGQVTAEVQAARDLVTGDGDQLPGLGGEVADALVTVLAEEGRVALLVRCGEEGSRELAKASRRALHGLKRRGAEVPRVSAKIAPRQDAHADAHADALAVVSAPFGDGEQAVVFRYRGTNDRVLHSGTAMVSDVSGLRDLKLFRGGAKTYRSMVESARSSLTIAPAPFGFVLGIVARGAQQTEARGRLVPELFPTLRQQLGDAWPAAGEHPGRDLAGGELPDAEGQFELWELPELRTWLPSSEPLEELGAGVQDVLGSAIVINEQQRLERLTGVLDRVTARVFDAEARPRWIARLLDAAFVAHGNRREDAAPKLLAVRAALESTDCPEQLPFCRQLVARPLLGRLPEPFASGLIPGLPLAPDRDPEPEPEPPNLLWTPDKDPEPGPRGGGGLIVPGR